MRILTFARVDPFDKTTSVVAEVGAANRRFVQRYPTCSAHIVEVGDEGRPSEWVTVELYIRDVAPVGCVTWYADELTRARIALLNEHSKRQGAKEIQ
jgi:hypothetical protein